MRRPGTACIAIVTTLAAAVLMQAAPAVAHKQTYATEINHTGTTSPPLTFRGFISAPIDACFPKRSIEVTYEGTVVGSTKTDPQGRFTVEPSVSEPGDYVITVKRKVVRRSSRHRHVCGTDSVTATR